LIVDRLLELLGCRVGVGLQQKLDIGVPLGRDDREPAVCAVVDIGLLRETQDVRVELERLLLVVYKYACQFDLHG
jgi:hypothetical protein